MLKGNEVNENSTEIDEKEGKVVFSACHSENFVLYWMLVQSTTTKSTLGTGDVS